MHWRENPFLLTKILATVGPACNTPEKFAEMIKSGVRVARINFSHGSFEDFEQSLNVVREASKQTGIPIGVLGDLCGPKIRTKEFEHGGIVLNSDDSVRIVADESVIGNRCEESGVSTISTNYGLMVDEIKPNERIFINDGAVRLRVNSICGEGKEKYLDCQCIVGGLVSNKKGINLPDSDISTPSVTDWDKECVTWAVKHDLDYLALSFVRTAVDISTLNALLRQHGCDNNGRGGRKHLPIIAKIEKPQAIDDLDRICEKANAVMVARGDLGVEMDMAEVPVIQKKIIARAHDWGKPVIVATQMLQSMINEATPTRAEVSDVAGAIMEGADAVMLSGETAVGRYPLEATAVMARTARITEKEASRERSHQHSKPPKKLQENKRRTPALAHGVSVIVRDLQAKYVVVWTELGGTAQYMSQNRLCVPIIALSADQRTLRQMALFFGVFPMYMDRPNDSQELTAALDKLMLLYAWSDVGEPVVVCQGEPLGTPGITNTIRIHYVGDVQRMDWHDEEEESKQISSDTIAQKILDQ
ncbi:Pyruvate kinase [Poriferisphaera corsica]|uniref:Pyruvate kinase n=1 Tax=Poriferisphaera corsica TaxID=2528020 RepID=A0A517YP80_9BACT|nr:pyruvate kinase [Poriferisphaera corsica]QDU32028.1 Pyruvate kinase [Poriferisphaera corsica]